MSEASETYRYVNENELEQWKNWVFQKAKSFLAQKKKKMTHLNSNRFETKEKF